MRFLLLNDKHHAEAQAVEDCYNCPCFSTTTGHCLLLHRHMELSDVVLRPPADCPLPSEPR